MATSDGQSLADTLSIQRLIGELGRHLDDRDFDGLVDLFTPDAQVRTPGGTASGHAALVDQARRSHTDDEGIQHLITDVLIDLDGDTARARANLLVAFARTGVVDTEPFLLGVVYLFDLLRSPAGWRISRLSSRPVWTVNRPPQLAPLPAGSA